MGDRDSASFKPYCIDGDIRIGREGNGHWGGVEIFAVFGGQVFEFVPGPEFGATERNDGESPGQCDGGSREKQQRDGKEE